LVGGVGRLAAASSHPTHFRSSIDDFSALPANTGSAWIVSSDQGLFGLECTSVSLTLRTPLPRRISPCAVSADADAEAVVALAAALPGRPGYNIGDVEPPPRDSGPRVERSALPMLPDADAEPEPEDVPSSGAPPAPAPDPAPRSAPVVVELKPRASVPLEDWCERVLPPVGLGESGGLEGSCERVEETWMISM
jgi:hypothetical protein